MKFQNNFLSSTVYCILIIMVYLLQTGTAVWLFWWSRHGQNTKPILQWLRWVSFKKMVPCMALLGFLPIFWQICASSRGQQVCKLLVVCLMHTQNIFFLYTCAHTGQNLVFFCEVATKNNMLVSTSIFTGRIGWTVYWPKTNLSVDLELAKYIHPPSINRCRNFV